MKRLVLAIAVLAVVLAGSLVTRQMVISAQNPVVVVQWANSHPMREGLLPAMAEKFNDEDHRTSNGDPIKVVVLSCDSATQVDDLVERVQGSASEHHCKGPDGGRAPDPTIITPQSSDWLTDLNARAGTQLVDVDGSPHIAETWMGIVTYRAMAECLGWPAKQLGYQDIVDLRADPLGWERYPDCARPQEWGRRPLLDFTNPNTSTSGRNVLVSLYSMAAGKPPADLTVADVERPEVQESVHSFQQLVDHYSPGTIPLNTTISQGPSAGHFFLMPEDNLVSLYQGTEKAIGVDGTEQTVDPVQDLVMVYPKEGSVLNANPAAVLDVPWATPDQSAAADAWITFLRDDRQQQVFMERGFRPASGTAAQVDARQFTEWGLAAEAPSAVIEPSDLAPDVLARIVDSWGSVKKPAVVTFVVDVSGSMGGERLEQVKEGLGRVIGAMSATRGADDSQVGLVAFSGADNVRTLVPPARLSAARFDFADAVAGLEADGNTALYDAVEHAIGLTDEVDAEPGATRAIVVLSDGVATAGRNLDQIVSMASDREKAIARLGNYELRTAVDAQGESVAPEAIHGTRLLVAHVNDIQVFFVGFGEASIDVGRILAEATDAEYQESSEENLAAVIEEVSGYF